MRLVLAWWGPKRAKEAKKKEVACRDSTGTQRPRFVNFAGPAGEAICTPCASHYRVCAMG